jgi:predicted transcriptional regulator
MKTLTEHFHSTVEEFLERTGFKPTEFGRQAVGDPSLVLNLRRGRSPTLATADRILAFIRDTDAVTRKRTSRGQRQVIGEVQK